VYPTTVRATGYGLATAFARLGGALAPIVSEVAFASSPSAPFLIDSIVMLLAGLVSFALPIETVGKNLSDDIDDGNTAAPPDQPYKYTQASHTVVLLGTKKSVELA